MHNTTMSSRNGLLLDLYKDNATVFTMQGIAVKILKYIRLFFILIIGHITISSCSLQQLSATQTDTQNNKVSFLNIKVFQTLSNSKVLSQCLARNSNFDVFYILSFTCPGKEKNEIYYDGKNISGRYVFVGTYSYETKQKIEKTVQAYMPKDNFDDYYEYNKSELKDLLDIALSYNAIQ